MVNELVKYFTWDGETLTDEKEKHKISTDKHTPKTRMVNSFNFKNS